MWIAFVRDCTKDIYKGTFICIQTLLLQRTRSFVFWENSRTPKSPFENYLTFRTIRIQIGKIIGIKKHTGKVRKDMYYFHFIVNCRRFPKMFICIKWFYCQEFNNHTAS